MLASIGGFLRCVFVLSVLFLAGCSGCGEGIPPADTSTTSSSSTSTSTGSGHDAGNPFPCGVDCSKFETEPCMTSVCNTGQLPGPKYLCAVIAVPDGTECDDGSFCTKEDACQSGACVGKTKNDCGLAHNSCEAVLCDESSKSCSVTPVDDGTACTPTDLCQINGICQLGECTGLPKDCTFSPDNECNDVACDPKTGKCVATTDPDKENLPCVLSGDPCNVNKACQGGQCVGGTTKDCSMLNAGCTVGACTPMTGVCGPVPAPEGTPCTEDGIAACQIGQCEAGGECKFQNAADGATCNDHNSCTKEDVCAAGTCMGGAPVARCTLYLNEGFEVCPNGWTFGGDWQCGVPMNVGPAQAHSGRGCIATQIAAVYHSNDSYSVDVADSPTIDLTTATKPMLSFWAWDDTEGGTDDGWNLHVSTDGGQTFSQVNTVTPKYPLIVASEPAWGGDNSGEGWQNYSADLTAYAGKSIILRFAFQSDGATVYPGVYIDDVVVAEPAELPLYITTSSPLADVYAGTLTSIPIAHVGGSAKAVWSIAAGGVNTGWLAIDSATGVLTGTPTSANVGPVSLTLHIEEQGLPSNFSDQTFTFNVLPAIYYTSFEGTCPDGWTLAGTDWQCGVPTGISLSPTAAYVGSQCLATQLAGNYSASDSFATTTATSPDIDLTGATSPTLTFRMWLVTEGGGYDGVTLQISTDGGATYSSVTGVTPPYSLMISGQGAWGGHEEALEWQLVVADLSSYAGQHVLLRFAFQSDASGEDPGVYIDDFLVK